MDKQDKGSLWALRSRLRNSLNASDEGFAEELFRELMEHIKAYAEAREKEATLTPLDWSNPDRRNMGPGVERTMVKCPLTARKYAIHETASGYSPLYEPAVGLGGFVLIKADGTLEGAKNAIEDDRNAFMRGHLS